MCRFPVAEVYQCFYLYNCNEHKVSYRYPCQVGFLNRRECPGIDKSPKPIVDDMIVGLCPTCTSMGREQPAPPPTPTAESFFVDLYGNENIIDGKTQAWLALNPAAKLYEGIKAKLEQDEKKEAEMDKEIEKLMAEIAAQR